MAVLLLLADTLQVSWPTVLMAIILGGVTFACNLFLMKSLETGPMAPTVTLTQSSMMIPALSGWLFWHETISTAEMIGFILMLAMIPFAAQLEGKKKKTTFRWFLFCLIALLSSGSGACCKSSTRPPLSKTN